MRVCRAAGVVVVDTVAVMVAVVVAVDVVGTGLGLVRQAVVTAAKGIVPIIEQGFGWASMRPLAAGGVVASVVER